MMALWTGAARRLGSMKQAESPRARTGGFTSRMRATAPSVVSQLRAPQRHCHDHGRTTGTAASLTSDFKPRAIAVAPDGRVYVGENDGCCVRQIRGGKVSTIWRGGSGVHGLLLDGNLLFVAAGQRIFTIVIGTLAEQQETRYYPALQTWALMQEEERPQLTPSADESAVETRARCALCLLMDCPIPDILVRTLRFLYE